MAHELLESATKDEVVRECAQVIAYCGDCMHSLINDLLDYEKIEADQLQLEIKPFSVISVMKHLYKVLEYLKLSLSLFLSHSHMCGTGYGAFG